MYITGRLALNEVPFGSYAIWTETANLTRELKIYGLIISTRWVAL
jgi:hypothetical protein